MEQLEQCELHMRIVRFERGGVVVQIFIVNGQGKTVVGPETLLIRQGHDVVFTPAYAAPVEYLKSHRLDEVLVFDPDTMEVHINPSKNN